MSREKRYTPGPWWAEQNTAGDWVVCTIRDDQSPEDAGQPYGASVARSIADHTETRTRGKGEANAHLMAAAPDLLEELEDRLAADRCGCGHPACKPCQRDAETERVIAKAYGEDQ